MITPVLLIIISIGISFLITIFPEKKGITFLSLLVVFATMIFIPFQWGYQFMFNNALPFKTAISGTPIISTIVFKMGIEESIVLIFINILAFLNIFYIFNFKNIKRSAAILYMVLFMGLNGAVLSYDIFNIFIFIEISTISLAGLLIVNYSKNGIFYTGFKYLVATSIISGFLLLGIIFTYHFTQSLNLDVIKNIDPNKGLLIALLSILIPFLLKLKPFLTNGWAVDFYKKAPPIVSLMFSTAVSTVMIYVFWKIFPIFPEKWGSIIIYVGLITYIGTNIVALKEQKVNSLLGYSSISQFGLIVAIIGLSYKISNSLYIAATILLTHYFAKTILFWISSLLDKKDLKDWAVLKSYPLLMIAAIVSFLTLVAIPPFPSFFAKWELIMELGNKNQAIIWLILLGSLIETVYIFRWIGYIVKGKLSEKIERVTILKCSIIYIFVLALIGSSVYASTIIPLGESLVIFYPPLIAFFIFSILDFLPVYIKNLSLIVLGSYYSYILIFDKLYGFSKLFAIIFLVGGVLTLIPGFAKEGKRVGFYPFVILMFTGLAGIIQSENLLQFFISWEFLTIGSYFLILRGKKSEKPALSYILFSQGGAYLILFGFSLIYSLTLSYEISSISQIANYGNYSAFVFTLLAIGFLTKTAAVGLHIWLPGAHAEAESDVSPMVSAILLKAGVFGLLTIMLQFGEQKFGSIDIAYVLSWIGVLTALIGNILAALQEDAKKLLAYSSIGQLGYVVFALSFMTHIGWLTGIAFAFNHFLFKALLFLAIGGVVLRVKTKNMYQMGGLIKKMPLSFISVLIGIIALSGVPPLTGFAGKWLSYNAILEKGWYFQGAVMIFSGLVAFLYCFRLIHTIFLGQPKDNHKNIKEAPIWYIIPQMLIVLTILAFSILPNIVLKPIGNILMKYFPKNPILWEGNIAISNFGYWDGFMIMQVTGAIFVTVFIWLIFINRKAIKVKQFNIVYAAERPFTPETTHFAYNFFAPYKRALGGVLKPRITIFWDIVVEFFHSIAQFFKNMYSGKIQAYSIYMIIFIIIIYFSAIGGL